MTSNFWCFTDEYQHIPETNWATGQMYWLLLDQLLPPPPPPPPPIQTNSAAQRQSECGVVWWVWVCVRVCVCVYCVCVCMHACVCWWVFDSRALVVVFTDGSVPERLQSLSDWLPWTAVETLYCYRSMSHWARKMSSAITVLWQENATGREASTHSLEQHPAARLMRSCQSNSAVCQSVCTRCLWKSPSQPASPSALGPSVDTKHVSHFDISLQPSTPLSNRQYISNSGISLQVSAPLSNRQHISNFDDINLQPSTPLSKRQHISNFDIDSLSNKRYISNFDINLQPSTLPSNRQHISNFDISLQPSTPLSNSHTFQTLTSIYSPPLLCQTQCS